MGEIKCIGILTSGGDAPAMNAAISAKESAYEANRNAAAASARADAASKAGAEAKTKVDKLKRDINDN